jgi:uncharacterized protein YaaW (UPF0174 family)
MTTKFISNLELRNLLEIATDDERLALTRIIDKSQNKPFNSKKLQEEICLFGGHGIANVFRGSGTGYLDIIDDVAEVLEIKDRELYSSRVKYYDKIYYIKGEKYDTSNSSRVRKYTRPEAKKLGLEYTIKHEQKIIIKVMENAYKQMVKNQEDLESRLSIIIKRRDQINPEIINFQTELESLKEQLKNMKLGFIGSIFTSEDEKRKRKNEVDSLNRKINSVQKKLTILKEEKEEIPRAIEKKENEVLDAMERVEKFNEHLSETVLQFNSSSIGTITGTAGLMALANLGGFATYTFLTSMISALSFGTLGFGAYTAATSFLSVVIGPVGWTGLGLWALFSLGKPNMSKLVLIVATIGAIRQRVLYEKQTPQLLN